MFFRLLFLFSILCSLASAATHNVRTFGATGDGATKDTRAFHEALAICAAGFASGAGAGRGARGGRGVKQNRVDELPAAAGMIARQMEGYPIEFRNVWLESL